MDYQDNPYYNNSNQTQYNSFGIASLVCGILATLAACCTGVLGIPIGALGMIFAFLGTRQGKMPDPMVKAGLWLNGIALGIGLLITIYAIRIMLMDPNYLNNVMEIYQRIEAGESYMEIMQDVNNGTLTL